MSDTPFPRDTHLTAIAIAYKNPDTSLIADAVLPRVTVNKKEFGYFEYPTAELYTVPDTRVGERSRVNQVEITGTRKTDQCEDYGIDIPLTADDIREAAPGTNPRDKATERATNIVLLDREKRVADLLFNAGSYPDAVKTSLSGANQWSHADSNPISAILAGLDAAYIRPNVLVLGQEVWRKLSTHTKVVQACLGTSATYGVATRERLAEILEVQEILVGPARVNSVKPGKTPVLLRVWGKHALALYRDRTVDTSGGITFGVTAQRGTRFAGSKQVDMGIHGGELVRCAETVKEKILAPLACYFWADAVV